MCRDGVEDKRSKDVGNAVNQLNTIPGAKSLISLSAACPGIILKLLLETSRIVGAFIRWGLSRLRGGFIRRKGRSSVLPGCLSRGRRERQDIGPLISSKGMNPCRGGSVSPIQLELWYAYEGGSEERCFTRLELPGGEVLDAEVCDETSSLRLGVN